MVYQNYFTLRLENSYKTKTSKNTIIYAKLIKQTYKVSASMLLNCTDSFIKINYNLYYNFFILKKIHITIILKNGRIFT